MFAIHTHNLPSLPTFAAAESYWLKADDPASSPRNTTWASNGRPLKDRRSYHLRLVRTFDIACKTMYQAYLYDTPMVTYYADGRITIRHHASQSSAKFVDRISPFAASIVKESLVVSTRTGSYVPDYALTIHPDGTVTGYKQLTKRVLDKSGAAKLRHRLKPFFDYWQVRELVDKSFQPSQRWLLRDLADRLIATPDDHTVWVEAAFRFLDAAECRNTLYEQAGLYRDEPLPPGVLP